MKKIILITACTLFAIAGWSQENRITLSGGYSFANIEDTEVKATGWRINAVYEFNPEGGKFAHGLSVGYVNISGEETQSITTTYDIGAWPIYYAPKFLFGSDKAKGFVKGAIGWQFSNLERSGALILEDNDAGFTGGGGAGLMYNLSEKIFLSAEYELLWLSNSFYKDGWLNTASVGLGIKF
jgi:hypothetical protein